MSIQFRAEEGQKPPIAIIASREASIEEFEQSDVLQKIKEEYELRFDITFNEGDGKLTGEH